MKKPEPPVVLVISSYPPRLCGIATYTQDLVNAFNTQYNHTFRTEVCALHATGVPDDYPPEVTNVLHTADANSYIQLAHSINKNTSYSLVLIQHEFGLFNNQQEALLDMLRIIHVPVMMTFHTVLPNPSDEQRAYLQQLSGLCNTIIVMTKSAASVLEHEYHLHTPIAVIQHGTHLIEYKDKDTLKRKYGFTGKSVLATFGLISSGKSIETTLQALPAIALENPDVLFLIIGRTHPTVAQTEGEAYRNMLQEMVTEKQLNSHVRFINGYIPLPELLDYLQLTDIYLFTSKDQNQAVSGTFSYALSCGCPIISTRIPHAVELLGTDSGILIDFEQPKQLGDAVNRLLKSTNQRDEMRITGLHKTASTAWENIAIAYVEVFSEHTGLPSSIQATLPPINLNHLKKLTTNFGALQFSVINQPNPASGYTLDDNARALISACMYYSQTSDSEILPYINIYLNFICYCAQQDGSFLNYVDTNGAFTPQNKENLDDANGRAIWALGYLLHHQQILPFELIITADALMKKALKRVSLIYSSRSLGFIIKGLYHYHSEHPDPANIRLADMLASRLERMYEHESGSQWHWFEAYMTYANAILPESMLCAYLMTQNETYKKIASSSLHFLLEKTLSSNCIKPISNDGWLHRGRTTGISGQQPIDVSYTIMAMDHFYSVLKEKALLEKMQIAFSWYSGNNHLRQIIYNPHTGGCYDGLEKDYVNLNQGAESTLSYLMARLTMEKHQQEQQNKTKTEHPQNLHIALAN